MRFYFSGYDAVKAGDLKDWMIRECPWRLQSCHEVHMKSTMEWLERSAELGICGGVDLMLDSGAFTAWNAGHHTTIDELMPVYQDLVKRFGHLFKSIVLINLDVIPGSREKAPTDEEIDLALIGSDVNFKLLEKEFGPIILPVFHQGEPWDRLDVICNQSQYVCLSPRQTLSEELRVKWVREAGIRVEGKGIDLHGLATTGNTIIRAVDWFSVDSASWLISAAFGSVLLNLDGNISSLPVSKESPNLQMLNKHMRTLSPIEDENVTRIIRGYGFEPDALMEYHQYRRAFNLMSMREWSKTIVPTKMFIEQELF